METQKIVNSLGDADNKYSKFATIKWYVINDQNNTDYGKRNEDSTTNKFETKVIKSSLCDYSNAYILVTGDITATGDDANIRVANIKNCAPFTKCITNINDEHVEGADNLDIIMPMYNFIEYSDNYSDISESQWQFKRDESPVANAGNPDNVSTANSSSFKYKSSFFKPLRDADNGVFKNVKIAVPLKYLSNFWRSLEMPLINCKIHLELNWTKDCVIPTIADTRFEITSTKLYVSFVTLSGKDNVKLVKLLKERFKRSFIGMSTKKQTKKKNQNI